jgi:LPS-assembly protein
MERLSTERLLELPDDDSDTVTLEVGGFEAQFGDHPTASMTGGILFRQGSRLAGADSARYDPEFRALHFEGSVRYEDPATQVESDTAEFSYDAGRIRFEGARFVLGASSAHGSAKAIEINQQGRLELDGVNYTTCPPESDDWLLEAKDIDLDTREGVGTAKGIKLRFQGVPILYSPYISFPIGEARKSGILTPEVGSTKRSGTEFRIPWYWNIAPNYDATLTPRLLTDRGLQIQTQFRYLTESLSGEVDIEYLSSDSITNKARTMGKFRHESLLPRGWRNRIDFQEVSDLEYFEDLGGSLSIASITHLDRSVSFDVYTKSLWFIGQIQDYQTLDDAILPADEPYRRAPQLFLRGSWPDSVLGLDLNLESELVNFDRNVGVTGWRLNVSPELELPIKRPGWFITPAVAFDYTRYELDNTEPGQATDPSRALPIGSLDVGMILERTMSNGDGNRLQTIEPRLLYVHVPFREQSDMPVFDTITPDLNLVQLFRKNRYLGLDRIADTDQLSIGVTSRILNVANGRELLSATIGQTRYLSISGVTLPGEPLITDETSDYVAEVSFLLAKSLNFDLGHQWGEKERGTTQSQARLQYRPADDKVLNLAYRFRRDTLEQGDLSWSWPVSSKWNFVGRYNFSFRDDEPLEQFFGLEYESCCWGLRLVSRRHISTRDGTRDSSFGLQLVLKGLSSVGTAADRLLERGILGYSANLR